MKRSLSTLLILTLASTAGAQSGAKRLAVVNGEVITEDQVHKAVATELEALDLRRAQHEMEHARDKHQITERALNRLVEDKLIAAEAVKKNMTVEALLKAEIDDRVTMPKPEVIKAFYDANQSRIDMPEEQALQQIGPYLMQQEREEQLRNLVARLKKEHAATIYLDPHRVNVPSEGFPSRGPADAAVTIVEFSDFECPFCAALFPALNRIETTYAGKIRLVFRQFPLDSIHSNAQKAAEASLCAGDQERFWEMHDAMFNDPRSLGIDALKSKAAGVKMDAAAFNACLDSGKHAGRVRADVVDGVRSGVSGTPALFINGRPLLGAQPYEEIAKIIEDEFTRTPRK